MRCFSKELRLTPRSFILTRYFGLKFLARKGDLHDLREAVVSDRESKPELLLVEAQKEHKIVDLLSVETSDRVSELINNYIDEYDR